MKKKTSSILKLLIISRATKFLIHPIFNERDFDIMMGKEKKI